MRILLAAKAAIDRVDVLGLRERAMVFAAVCVVIVAFAWTGFLDPSLIRQKAYTNTLAQKQQEIVLLQTQIGTLMQARATDKSGPRRQTLDAERRKLAELDRLIEDRRREMVPPDRVAAVLTDMLRTSRNVEITGMQSLAAAPISVVEADASVQGGTAGMYRHGLEVTMAGQYLDLLNYLAAIERLPVKIFSGGLSIDATQYPRNVLKLTVVTLSSENKWLQI